MKKFAFFDQKHGLTFPFGKMRFLGLSEIFLLQSKTGFFFLHRTLLNLISNLVLTKNK